MLPPFLHSVSLKREEISSYDEYPFNIAAVRHLETIKLHPNVTFLVGDNGTGKSTLLEAIAVSEGFNPEGGSRDFSFATRESHSCLHKYIWRNRGKQRMGRTDGFFLRAESYFNVATELEKLDEDTPNAPKLIRAYGGKSLHEQSHGESFWSLISNRFRGNGLYILDEPEAALSPSRQLSLLSIINELVQSDSQFIIATHSPIIMAYPQATIYNFTETGINATPYEETEHYKITKMFLDCPERMLAELMRDEP